MSTDNMIVQKDERPKKRRGLSVREKIRLTSATHRREQKQRRKGQYADPFPAYKYKTIQHPVRALSEDATEAEKEDNKLASSDKVLILSKGYPNLPTQRGIQIGEKRGNGKRYIASKGRIVTRRRMKRSQRGKSGVLHA